MIRHTLEQVRTAIRQSSDLFERHFEQSDSAALVRDYYVEEPVISGPDSPLLRDRQAITQVVEEVMKSFKSCRLEQVEVRIDDKLAYELGRAALVPRDGGANMYTRYMIAWRHTSAGWRAEADFFALGTL
jgi:hypothetical protein